ncbi:hypothetical protein D3C87_1743220 [compost metagenome]
MVRLCAPLITPERVVLAVLLIVAAPLSAIALSMVVAPLITSVVPAARVMAPEPRLLLLETLRVPASTLVAA